MVAAAGCASQKARVDRCQWQCSAASAVHNQHTTNSSHHGWMLSINQPVLYSLMVL
jgi:hypothetical protein